MNGNIGRVNESIMVSFVVVFQTHVHGRRERAYRPESEEDHPGNHTSIMERCAFRASTYQGHGLRGKTHKKIYETL